MTPLIAIFNSGTFTGGSFKNSSASAALQASYCNARMNVVRFIAICSVVWGHCLLGLEKEVYTTTDYKIAQAVLIQGGRVGTIMFFMVSGFFLYDKIDRFTPLTYLRYRFYSIILPWIIFLMLLVFIQLSQLISFKQIVAGNFWPDVQLMGKLVKGSVFHATYWFIPVAVFSSVLLVACKQHIGKLWFGLMLGGISLIYCFNLYEAWFPQSHTVAILGYVFYLWLGLFVKKHINSIVRMLASIPGPVLFCALILMFCTAFAEAINLKSIGCTDAYSSLRLSNAGLSVLVFAIILKSPRLYAIDKLHPQKCTYGIYLVHSIIITLLVPYANKFIVLHKTYLNFLEHMAVHIAFFACVLTLTFLVVNLIRQSPFSAVLGLPVKQRVA